MTKEVNNFVTSTGAAAAAPEAVWRLCYVNAHGKPPLPPA